MIEIIIVGIRPMRTVTVYEDKNRCGAKCEENKAFGAGLKDAASVFGTCRERYSAQRKNGHL